MCGWGVPCDCGIVSPETTFARSAVPDTPAAIKGCAAKAVTVTGTVCRFSLRRCAVMTISSRETTDESAVDEAACAGTAPSAAEGEPPVSTAWAYASSGATHNANTMPHNNLKRLLFDSILA